MENLMHENGKHPICANCLLCYAIGAWSQIVTSIFVVSYSDATSGGRSLVGRKNTTVLAEGKEIVGAAPPSRMEVINTIEILCAYICLYFLVPAHNAEFSPGWLPTIAFLLFFLSQVSAQTLEPGSDIREVHF